MSLPEPVERPLLEGRALTPEQVEALKGGLEVIGRTYRQMWESMRPALGRFLEVIKRAYAEVARLRRPLDRADYQRRLKARRRRRRRR